MPRKPIAKEWEDAVLVARAALGRKASGRAIHVQIGGGEPGYKGPSERWIRRFLQLHDNPPLWTRMVAAPPPNPVAERLRAWFAMIR